MFAGRALTKLPLLYEVIRSESLKVEHHLGGCDNLSTGAGIFFFHTGSSRITMVVASHLVGMRLSLPSCVKKDSS